MKKHISLTLVILITFTLVLNVCAYDIDSWLLVTGDNSDNVLHGTSAMESFAGLCGNDLIYANAGNDILNGGSGDDFLIGGSGNDRFYYRAPILGTFPMQVKSNHDIISDFTVGDTLVINSFLPCTPYISGNNFILKFSNNNTLTILNIAKSEHLKSIVKASIW